MQFGQRLPVSGLSDLIGTNGALCSTELECALNLARALCCFNSSSSCNRRNHCTENCTQLCMVHFRFQTSQEIMDDKHIAATQIAFFLGFILKSLCHNLICRDGINNKKSYVCILI